MRSDLASSTTSRHPALIPDVAAERSGPVTVAVGDEVDNTLRAGTLVAHRLERGIAVISVLEPVAVYRWGSASVPTASDARDEMSLARWSFLEQQLRAAGPDGPAWSVDVLWGGVPRTLARAAHELRSPFLVLGAGQRRRVDRVLGGETALRAIRHSDCPVLVVGAEFVALPRVIVAGTDLSDASAHAVRTALPLLGPDAVIHLVHAWTPELRRDGAGAPREDQRHSDLPGRISRFLTGLDLPPTLALQVHVVDGRPAERLIELAEDVGAELIVVGRHGRGVLERLLVGSVATQVLRGAQRSVLVVPEPAPIARLRLKEKRGESSRVIERSDWAAFLDRFTRLHAGRLVALDVNDPSIGLRAQERGSVLFGASYDARENVLEIILGEPHGRRRRLTRVIPDASAMLSVLGADDEEEGLHIEHGTGETLLSVPSITVRPER